MSFLQHMLFLFVIILMINSIYSSTIDIELTTQSIIEIAIIEMRNMHDDLKKEEKQLKIDRQKFEEEKMQIPISINKIDVLQLNVGGEMIITTRETLTKISKSILSIVFNGRWEHKLQRDQNGNIFLDFNPILFRHLLDQLQIIEIDNSIHLYPPFQSSLVDPFNKMIKKSTLPQLEKNDILTFNVDGKMITSRRTTFTQVLNSTFDRIISSSQQTNFNNESDVFVDYDPKLFQYLINQLRKQSFKSISSLQLSSNEERIFFEKMLIDFNIYRATTATPFRIITNANDGIVAIYNATAGGPSLNSTPGYGAGQYVPSQGPTVCIDFSGSTCLNFGNAGISISSSTAGIGTGVYTIPIVGVSIVCSIQFQTGGDVPARDPLTITLEGSNAIGTALSHGSSWTLLYSGATGLAPFDVSRSAWGEMQNFTNTRPFTAYRMIVTSQRAADHCTQFAEMHLFGFI